MNKNAFLKSQAEASAYYMTHARDIRNIEACLNSIITASGMKSYLSALVVGCGNGQHDLLPLVKKLLNLNGCGKRHVVIAVDKSEPMIKLLVDNLKSNYSYLEEVPFPDGQVLLKIDNIDIIPIHLNIEDDVVEKIKLYSDMQEISFDVIILFSILQHATNWRQVLNTLIHTVKKGGSVLVDEWFDGPLTQLDIAQKNNEWHYYFSLREKYTGIFWDPEVKAHDILAVKNYFLGHGFDLTQFEEQSTEPNSVRAENLTIVDQVKNAHGFGPLSWGKGSVFQQFSNVKLKNENNFYVPKEPITFKVYCFQNKNQNDNKAVKTANLITSSPVYETRIMNHFCVDINPSLLSAEKFDIRQVQAVQLGLQYSCFSAKTQFAFPIQAKIDIATGAPIDKRTETVKTILVPSGKGQIDVLTRLISNMLVLKYLVDLGSVTAELLSIFQRQPQYSNCSFRLIVNNNYEKLSVKKIIIDGVDVIECYFPCYNVSNDYNSLRSSIKSNITDMITANIRYTFGEYDVVDLSGLMPLEDDCLNIINKSVGDIKGYHESIIGRLGEFDEYKEILSLFSKLVPMMSNGEVLLLIFSPCQFLVDENEKKVKSISFGALAILETQFDEPESMFAFRLARLEFLNLVLQWERYSQMHELSHMRGELLKKHSQMLELLEAPLRRLTDAHRKIQEDTQELRAILYEPTEGIYAAQREIAELFNLGNTLTNPDRSKVIIQHQPANYQNIDDARWVLAHALSRFRGSELRGFSPSDALKRESDEIKSSAIKPNHPLNKFAIAIGRIFDINLQAEEKFYELMQEKPTYHLEKLKRRLFSPFKPDDSSDSPISWAVLHSLLPPDVELQNLIIDKLTINNADVKKYLSNDKIIAVVKGANPFSIHGHLLSFISCVISQHVNENSITKILASIDIEGCEMKDGEMTVKNANYAELSFTSSSDWITDTNGLKERIEKEIECRKNDIIATGEYGDFYRPFINIIRRYPKKNYLVTPEFINGLTLKFGEKLIIIFKKGCLSILSGTKIKK